MCTHTAALTARIGRDFSIADGDTVPLRVRGLVRSLLVKDSRARNKKDAMMMLINIGTPPATTVTFLPLQHGC
jgi:hypothetical protein